MKLKKRQPVGQVFRKDVMAGITFHADLKSL
jgi:hypothetical protein